MEPVKNKTMTYLLICAVAMVWGIIVYRVFFNDTEEDDLNGVVTTKAVHEPYDQYVAKNDTFHLALNYRDPFLGKMMVTPAGVKVSSPKPVNRMPPKPIPPALNWETIRYTGYITNPTTKKVVAILSVNGMERMTAEGESFQGVKLLKNKKDSILVSWMGKQKYIRQ
jgi:hypothetical protein